LNNFLCCFVRWIVFDSKYAVDDPTYLCERCLRNSHYEDEEEEDDKEKISEVLSESNNPSNSQTGETNEELNQTKESNPTSSKKLKKLCNFKAYHFSQI